MIQEMAKSQKSVMEREREDLVVVFFLLLCFVLLWELANY